MRIFQYAAGLGNRRRIKLIKIAAELFIVIFLAVSVASSGSVFEFRDTATHFNAVGDAALTSGFFYKDFVAGVIPTAKTDITLESQTGAAIPTITDFKSSLSTENAYYSRLSSDVSHELSINGQEPNARSISANMYIIMPKKFDSTQSFSAKFLDENDPEAEIKTVFTYDNVEYEFTEKLDDSEFNLFLQPYCPQFEGLGLDYEDNFRDSIHINGLEYEGNMAVRAVKIDK
jgi:hypothetical protein